ncbi:hypothetical protein NKH72_22010 [Mesorhizobium sp. M0955]|uniref:hypothetical protein n=1 Tax=Mesorhizobium sp. M0955 TaxID=2957033 RepID=UPI00333786D9
MITEDQVVDAYRRALQLKVRERRQSLQETSEQFEERLDAIAAHDLLHLQYLAQEIV